MGEQVDVMIRGMLLFVARTVRSTRRALGLTQQQLADRCGLAQATISNIERAIATDLPLGTAVRVLAALDVDVDLVLRPPHIRTPRAQGDAAHARCVAHVRRRLETAGWLVATEIEVGGGRWHGWIDILAFHPGEQVLLVVEIKTEIHDLGEIDRQLGWYERGAWSAAHRLGWQPRAVTGVLLVLATEANDARLSENRQSFAQGYPVRVRDLTNLVADPKTPPRRQARGLAMIDPRSHRADWLRATVLDGRRSSSPYRDYGDFMASPGPRPQGRPRPRSRRQSRPQSRHRLN